MKQGQPTHSTQLSARLFRDRVTSRQRQQGQNVKHCYSCAADNNLTRQNLHTSIPDSLLSSTSVNATVLQIQSLCTTQKVRLQTICHPASSNLRLWPCKRLSTEQNR